MHNLTLGMTDQTKDHLQSVFSGSRSHLIKGRFCLLVPCITRDPQSLLTTPASSRDSSWKFFSMLTGIQARETVSPKNVTWYLDCNKRWPCLALVLSAFLLLPEEVEKDMGTHKEDAVLHMLPEAWIPYSTSSHYSSILTSGILVKASLSKHKCPTSG